MRFGNGQVVEPGYSGARYGQDGQGAGRWATFPMSLSMPSCPRTTNAEVRRHHPTDQLQPTTIAIFHSHSQSRPPPARLQTCDPRHVSSTAQCIASCAHGPCACPVVSCMHRSIESLRIGTAGCWFREVHLSLRHISDPPIRSQTVFLNTRLVTPRGVS